MQDLTAQELTRYARHLTLPEIGLKGQQRLKQARVLCVGAGGLGASTLLYLAAAGIGTLGILDADCIEVSNLQRQVLYTVADIGKRKVDSAREKLLALNPHIEIITYPMQLTEENACEIISQYDVVIDGTDNYAARYLINDACFHLQKPDVFACILRFDGQCTVFATSAGPCYRCLFPEPPAPEYVPNCAEAGVIGALPGLLGTLQAIETMKLLLQIGTPLIGRVITVNALQLQWKEFALARNSECVLCAKHIAFKDLPRPVTNCQTPIVPEITIDEFNQLKQAKTPFFLLDVREAVEYAERNLGGYLIPLKEIPQRLTEINSREMIIVHCKSGGRSKQAVALLQQHGFTNVRSLQGGMTAWIT